MPATIDTAVIGAGPYGVSLAAHLKGAGVEHRIFGQPMIFWQKMLSGMYLKSPDFGSNLSTPRAGHTFVEWLNARGLPRQEPIPMSRFTQYLLDTQKQLVPEVEPALVASLRRDQGGFAVSLGTGEELRARRVVVAVGLSHFARIPAELERLPRELVSHTSDHTSYGEWGGKTVLVLGRGQSAMEAAAALNEAGAKVGVVTRRDDLNFWGFGKPNGNPSLLARLRSPKTVLGPGRLNFSLQHLPLWPHFLPDGTRLSLTLRHLGPSGTPWVRERVVPRAEVLSRRRVVEAREAGGRLQLRFQLQDGTSEEKTVDHLVCGTGYAADLDRLAFLEPELKGAIARIQQGPRLGWRFESSVPGLYFIGQAASLSFGPLFRFVAGAEYAAPTVARHIASSLRRARRRERAGLESNQAADLR